ncbi:MAG: hypothetical protein VYE73_11715 [Acidobacteriota bacterium]|nr:hypothetical protein [Acidobacteriota bacterium]
MQEAPDSLQHRLAPAEEIFSTWLMRVFGAAILVGSAWIDDAPPLEIVALIIALYVGARIATQFGAFVSAAPFQNRVLKAFFALGSLALLGGSFIVVATFVEGVARSVVG